ncbi:hypothetical protein [Austwickia sp. TVS 96-490-7B]|uniref:hypothetical protein n=1 Tax=Austwickia sp. TVS 96-490-7B TaxID=2830843 RepID=UPI001C55BF24|nr:hypothetical protein [Austwickia sp. TVS 96-490-7B]
MTIPHHHRATPGGEDPTASLRTAAAELDFRPVFRTMTRDRSALIASHPAGADAARARALRIALLDSPDLVSLDGMRAAGVAMALRAAPTPIDTPVLVPVTVQAALTDTVQEAFAALPAGSGMILEHQDVTADPRSAQRAVIDLRVKGVSLIAISGLTAAPATMHPVVAHAERRAVELIRPDILLLDVDKPLDYSERRESVSALVAAVRGARPWVVADSVGSAVDEWAAVSAGATHVAGPFVTATSQVADHPTTSVEVDSATRTPFEVIAAAYPPRVVDKEEMLAAGWTLEQAALSVGMHADMFVCAQHSHYLDERAVSTYRELVDRGVAVTMIGAGSEQSPVSGMLWGHLADDDPMTQEWIMVTLLPGSGMILAGRDRPVGTHTAERERRFDCIRTDDRVLAVRIAGMITDRVHHAAV